MKCESCGAEIVEGGKFCPYCGRQLKKSNNGFWPIAMFSMRGKMRGFDVKTGAQVSGQTADDVVRVMRDKIKFIMENTQDIPTEKEILNDENIKWINKGFPVTIVYI